MKGASLDLIRPISWIQKGNLMEIEDLLRPLIKHLNNLNVDDKISAINVIKEQIHNISPFKNEPVDCVQWIKNENVVSNDYNPNKVAPPEMELLEVSIINDGYTQPIVTFPTEDKTEIVDGFHRSRVGKESLLVKDRVMGYLPVVYIRKEKTGKAERISSTIRHNRARGKHQVSAMSEIVIELKNRNWNNKRIARELGMDEDEILRLCQISGLEDMFTDKDFNQAWISIDAIDEEIDLLTDDLDSEEIESVRIANGDDPNRIFFTYQDWEHVNSGFFDTKHKVLSHKQCEYKYKEFLSNTDEFAKTIELIIKEWPNACEHNLTNPAMNRIAWLGQASVAYKYGIPSKYSSGFQLLTEEQQEKANMVAFSYLNDWLESKGIDPISYEEALAVGRQVEIY